MADDAGAKVEVGKYLYVWKRGANSPAAPTALITAHGMGTLINPTKPMKRKGAATVPNLHFFVPHGHVVDDLGLSSFIDRTVNQTLTPENCPEYLLTKYTNTDYESKLAFWRKHNKKNENYHTVSYSRGMVDYDIITIRSRFDFKGQVGVPLSEILDELQTANYQYTDIYCAFCRGSKPDPTVEATGTIPAGAAGGAATP